MLVREAQAKGSTKRPFRADGSGCKFLLLVFFLRWTASDQSINESAEEVQRNDDQERTKERSYSALQHLVSGPGIVMN